ncbi:MAG: ABC transporter substrate-binding protein [Dehalococcoidia bacterium]|nr:ABC transporter substrate-binding protein [Dehalococcoidia bacterium]
MAHSRLGVLVLPIMVIGAMLLASCSSKAVDTTASTTSTKPYGSLVITANNWGSGPIDPTVTGSANTFQSAAAAVLDTLVGVSVEGKLIPALAERWEIATDGLTHTFYIRKGVKFHDGSDLTGADVKFSIERVIAPDSGSQDAPAWRPLIDRIELKDDFTVVLRLKQPQFELFQGGLSDFSGSQAVFPKKYMEQVGVDAWRKKPVGSGPWKVVNYQNNIRLDLEANEDYWGEVPKFKNLSYLYVPEAATQVAMLKTGESDLSEVAPDAVAGLKAAGLKIQKHDGAAQSFLNMFYDLNNPQKYAIGDVRVRKAASLAINRKEMADNLFNGYAEPSALWYVRPTAYFFDPNQIKVDPYDPDQAKKLLADAGYPNGFPTKIWDTGSGSSTSTIIQALPGYWRKIGINAEVATAEYAIVRAMWYPAHKPEIWNTFFGTVSGGGVFNFEKMIVAYHSTKGNFKNFKNPRLDELVDKVPMTVDPVEKKKLAQEAALLAKNEYNVIALLDHYTILALGSKVGSITPIKGIARLAYAFSSITHAK